jgi:murein L,D-transpeptidase YafK
MPNNKKLPDLPPFELAQYQYNTSLKKELQNFDIQPNTVRIFLRAFKQEQKLEAWAKAKNDTKFQLFKSYDFCKSSGKLGPKRKEGDLQIPEGFYHINRFNPKSKFHLSLGLNYPNASDLILSDKEKPGSDIFLHGGCVTVGCIPITDEKIRELYLLASIAKEGGQKQIPVHIFPFKMTRLKLKEQDKNNPNYSFWQSLEAIYQYFEKNKYLPSSIQIDENGFYSI